MSVIFQSAFAYDTQATPQAPWYGEPSGTTRGQVWCFCRVNTTRYIAQIVNPVLLSFHRQEGDMLFQQDNLRSHTAAVTQRAVRGVQQVPWPARSPDLTPIELVWDMI